MAGVLGFNTVVACVAHYRDEMGIVDITWGMMSVIASSIILFMRRAEEITVQMWIVFALISIWGIRLSVHIGRRFSGEDYRYVTIKGWWAHHGPVMRFLIGWFFIFIGQGNASLIIGAGAYWILAYSTPDQSIGPL